MTNRTINNRITHHELEPGGPHELTFIAAQYSCRLTDAWVLPPDPTSSNRLASIHRSIALDSIRVFASGASEPVGRVDFHVSQPLDAFRIQLAVLPSIVASPGARVVFRMHSALGKRVHVCFEWEEEG